MDVPSSLSPFTRLMLVRRVHLLGLPEILKIRFSWDIGPSGESQSVSS